MITSKTNRKQLIDFLIHRWRLIVDFAALERVFTAHYQYAKDNNLLPPQAPLVVIPQACRQIEIIKQRIMEILPEAHFINYTYEAPVPLNLGDFVEMYISDHHQCISKVKETMERLHIA